MSVIEGVLLEEKERNLLMQKQYMQDIAKLPKGSIVKKSKKSGDYYYLTYRSGEKVVSEYLGKNKEKIEKIRQDINKRKHLESVVKNLESELKLINRAVR